MSELPSSLKIVTFWLVLATVLFLGVQAWQRHEAQTKLTVQTSAAGKQVIIERSRDGHYHWPGRVNGVAVDFLVDTGATGTTVSTQLAQEAGLALGASFTSSTANGMVQGRVARATVELEGGLRFDNLNLGVLPALGDKPLLGMNVLGQLRLEQDGRRLIVTLPQQR